MKTLQEAWAWYQSTMKGAKRLAHLSKYWQFIPWESDEVWVRGIRTDNTLQHVEADVMAGDAGQTENGLDDLAVLLLFSVFEANVRNVVESQIRPELALLRHIILKQAGDDVLQSITEGSFYCVLEPFKTHVDNDLIEQVNQVRRYRNWVAHGRQPLRAGEQLPEVQPKDAYQRLSAFLALINSPIK